MHILPPRAIREAVKLRELNGIQTSRWSGAFFLTIKVNEEGMCNWRFWKPAGPQGSFRSRR